MLEKIFIYNDREYVVKLTRKAKLEIEDRQRNASRKMADDENAIEILSHYDEFQSLEEQIDKIEKMPDGKAKDKKLKEYNKKYLPIAIKIQTSDIFSSSIDKYELVYILIKNNPKNPELSKNDYEMMLFDLENEKGLIELEQEFEEMYNKVFYEINSINQALQKNTLNPKVN